MISNRSQKLVNNLISLTLMHLFPTTETDGEFHFISIIQEISCSFGFHHQIPIIRDGTKLNFLGINLQLTLTLGNLAFVFFLLEHVFSSINDLAYRNIARGDQNKIEVC